MMDMTFAETSFVFTLLAGVLSGSGSFVTGTDGGGMGVATRFSFALTGNRQAIMKPTSKAKGNKVILNMKSESMNRELIQYGINTTIENIEQIRSRI